MLRLHRAAPTAALWADRSTYDDRLIFHTEPWLRFVAESQRAELLLATLTDNDTPAGHFTALLSRRFGLRILGSPMAGWTTSYLGFNLRPGVSRRSALEALPRFAFDELGCAHLEIRDRGLTESDLGGLGLRWASAPTAVIDLRPDEDALFGAMASACRRNIRKADRSGVVIQASFGAAGINGAGINEAGINEAGIGKAGIGKAGIGEGAIGENGGGPEFAAEFYDQLRDVFAKQNLVPTYPIDRVRSLIRHLGPAGNLLLLRARDPAGRCIATAVLPFHHRTMYFWGGASYRADQHLRPNEALIWYALRWARARGITEFDFVGGNAYKAKYGTREVPVPWARRSRSPLVAGLRDAAQQGYALKQRTVARLINAH